MPAPRLKSVPFGVAAAAAMLAIFGPAAHGRVVGNAADGAYSRPGTLERFEVPYASQSDHLLTTAALFPVSPGLLRAPGAGPSFATIMRTALAAYRAGNLGLGDALSSGVEDPVVRTALDWAALHAPAGIPFSRFSLFLSLHPRWPGTDWTRRQAEEALWRDKKSPAFVINFFAHQQPLTAMGQLALARAFLQTGDRAKAAKISRSVWRRDILFPSLEKQLRDEFGDFLTAADDKRRADRLLYRGDVSGGLRAAAHAGKAELTLARIRVAVLKDRASPKVMASIPHSLKNDPSFLFARIVRLEQIHKFKEAARLMLGAPHDATVLVDPDAWWVERRQIERKLLDLGQAKLAYEICATAVPGRPEANLEAAFDAGWIALRFLHDARLAQPHFAKLAALARTPVSRARGDYWLGRTFAALKLEQQAKKSFQAAAVYATTYYGQLAAQTLGAPIFNFTASEKSKAAAPPSEATEVVALLDSFGDTNLAKTLAIETARKLTSKAQLLTLADVGRQLNDAGLTLIVGKIAVRRGFGLTRAAFPTFGVPDYVPVRDSASKPIVYAIARQESSFQTHAQSSAGARGMMQMIVSTARMTARRFKIPFDPARLTSDPAFNVQLGAAHLGMLLKKLKGSLILTFAAYNAGEHRVSQWIKAYGDPRRKDVDPVDWVERIPIAETRNYVERVMENYTVYEALFARLPKTQKLTIPVSSPIIPAPEPFEISPIAPLRPSYPIAQLQGQRRNG